MIRGLEEDPFSIGLEAGASHSMQADTDFACMRPILTDTPQVIISGKSSPEVLTQEGFLNYARAIGLYASPFRTQSAYS